MAACTVNHNSSMNEERPEYPYEQPLFSGLYRQVRGGAQRLDPGALDTMMVRIFGAIEHTISGLRGQDPPPRPLVCEAGCNYCCSVQVQVLAPEVLYLAGYLKRTRRQEELAALSTALADFGDQVKDLTPDRRFAMKAPCLLLVDGLCSVYEGTTNCLPLGKLDRPPTMPGRIGPGLVGRRRRNLQSPGNGLSTGDKSPGRGNAGHRPLHRRSGTDFSIGCCDQAPKCVCRVAPGRTGF